MKNKFDFYLHPFFRITFFSLGMFLCGVSVYQEYSYLIHGTRGNLFFIISFLCIGIFLAYRGSLMHFQCDDLGVSIKVLNRALREIKYLQIESISKAWYFLPVYVMNIYIGGRHTTVFLGPISKQEKFFDVLKKGNPNIRIYS